MKLLRRLRHIPLYLRSWNLAFGAAQRQEWEAVIAALEPLADRGVATSESHYWMADAHCRLGHWGEAVAEFEQVHRRRRNLESEARLNYNYAYSLAKLGRVNEAIALLEHASNDIDLTHLKTQAHWLLEHLRSGKIHDLRLIQ